MIRNPEKKGWYLTSTIHSIINSVVHGGADEKRCTKIYWDGYKWCNDDAVDRIKVSGQHRFWVDDTVKVIYESRPGWDIP